MEWLNPNILLKHNQVLIDTNLNINELSNVEYWVGDTGATVHIMNTNTGMISIKPTKNNESIVMGNGTPKVLRLQGW
jgi:hypothetical protein